MQPLYDPEAPKKPINLSLNSDLLEKCRAMNIDLSATLEAALQHKLVEALGAGWSVENSTEIRAYNELVATNGCFAEDYRAF